MEFREKLFLILFIILSYQSYIPAEIATGEELRIDQSSVKPQEKKKEANACKQLEPGQSLTINEGRSESPTGIMRNYKLTKDKTNPKRYIASVNLNFLPTFNRIEEKYGFSPIAPNDNDLPFLPVELGGHLTRKDEIRAAMIGRVKECFKKEQGKVRSPDGTILDFELLSTSSAEVVTKVPISIMTKR